MYNMHLKADRYLSLVCCKSCHPQNFKKGNAPSQHCHLVIPLLHSEAQNCTLFIFTITFVKSPHILIIFGSQTSEWICNKMVTKLPTSPSECHYTTLWNIACKNLFITTIMQALNVMANWQLWANTLRQMFNVFGFDTCIKTISPLIKCLINGALFDAVNSCAQYFFRQI